MIHESIDNNTILEIKGDKENIDILNKVFNNVELTHSEERTLIWLSTWEKSVVNNIVSAFQKV